MRGRKKKERESKKNTFFQIPGQSSSAEKLWSRCRGCGTLLRVNVTEESVILSVHIESILLDSVWVCLLKFSYKSVDIP